MKKKKKKKRRRKGKEDEEEEKKKKKKKRLPKLRDHAPQLIQWAIPWLRLLQWDHWGRLLLHDS